MKDFEMIREETADKRLVAKRACLPCRARKIKCDGEQILLEATGMVCSNCLSRDEAEKCVFVRSLRGGARRKSKKNAHQTSSKSSFQTSLKLSETHSPEGLSEIAFIDDINGTNVLDSVQIASVGDLPQTDDNLLTQIPPPLIYVSDNELAYFGFPSWPVTCELIDLYYFYFNPTGGKFICPKERLMNDFNPRKNTSFYHAILLLSCRFFPDYQYSPEYHMSQVEKYWDTLDMQGLCTTMCCLVVNSLYCNTPERFEISASYTRTVEAFALPNIVSQLYYDKYVTVANKMCLIQRHEQNRLVWWNYLSHVILRVSGGFPYHDKEPELTSRFHNDQVPLPWGDDLWSMDMYLWGDQPPVEDMSRTQPPHWDELQVQFYSAVSKGEKMRHDGPVALMVFRVLCELLDSISKGELHHGRLEMLRAKIITYDGIIVELFDDLGAVKMIRNVSLQVKIITCLSFELLYTERCRSLLLFQPFKSDSIGRYFVNPMPSRSEVAAFFGSLSLSNPLKITSLWEAVQTAFDLVDILNSVRTLDIPIVSHHVHHSKKAIELKADDYRTEHKKLDDLRGQLPHPSITQPIAWLQFPAMTIHVAINALAILCSYAVLKKVMVASPVSGGLYKIYHTGAMVLEVYNTEISLELITADVQFLLNKMETIRQYIRYRGSYWNKSSIAETEEILDFVRALL